MQAPAFVMESSQSLRTEPKTAITKVLVVEDLPGLRNHLSDIVKKTVPGSVEIFEARNGLEAVELANTMVPTLIVMDISMPVLNGIKAAQRIWEKHPRMKILFWSQYHREIYIRDLGRIVPDHAIHGYVLKGESDEKLAYAISCVLLYDNPYIDPVVRGIKARLSRKSEALTDVEYETLQDIALGLTDKAIAMRRHISARGVQNRISLLFAKLLQTTRQVEESVEGLEIYNQRSRIIFEALKRGLLDTDELPALDKELSNWLEEEFSQGTC